MDQFVNILLYIWVGCQLLDEINKLRINVNLFPRYRSYVGDVFVLLLLFKCSNKTKWYDRFWNVYCNNRVPTQKSEKKFPGFFPGLD